MDNIDFTTIVRYAWLAYDSSRTIRKITDISAKVSTNHVYKVQFKDDSFIIAKLSYFGKYEHFVEDHTIVNVLANNLPEPFDNFLARSLMKGNELFVHRFTNKELDAWVVFYRPVKIKTRLPRRLDPSQIEKLAKQLALFHKACYKIRLTLPPSSKTLIADIHDLQNILQEEEGHRVHGAHMIEIQRQCKLFLNNYEQLGLDALPRIPVFIDWNLGNFSVTSSLKLYSRWDYDWFRMSTRMMDFYFFSRLVSEVGDRTVFSYLIDPLMEDRFIRFLKAYHAVFPLTRLELQFLREGYRFFILNYVIKYGTYFFAKSYATKLQQEAFDLYFPSVDTEFEPEKLMAELGI